MALKKTLPELVPEERALVDRIGFDELIMRRIKSHNIPHFDQLTVHHVENTHSLGVPTSGFTYDTFQRRAELHVRDEREPLSRLGIEFSFPNWPRIRSRPKSRSSAETINTISSA